MVGNDDGKDVDGINDDEVNKVVELLSIGGNVSLVVDTVGTYELSV